MSHNWGPHYLVPTRVFESYSGVVELREDFDEVALEKDMKELGIPGQVGRVVNPWYYRKKDSTTWIKIGESGERERNFPVKWDTTKLENGQYEIMGLMHVFVKRGRGEKGIARQNVVEVTVKN